LEFKEDLKMKKLALAALVFAGLGQATGCIFVADDPSGNFRATWEVTVNDQVSSCEAVGAARVSVLSTNSATGEGNDDIFNCTAYAGVTDLYPVGDYTIVMNILDASDNALSDMIPLSTSIDFDGETVNLSLAEFAFTVQTHALDFDVHFGDDTVTGGNCVSSTTGAGIAQQQINLISGTECLAFTIGGDITDVNGAVTTESTCTPFLCQEDAVLHTIAGVTPGTYTMEILGFKSGVGEELDLCYQTAISVTVGATDQDLGTIEAPFDPDPADDAACNATKPVRS
jgi:hypothetical protein